ncbi:uncharacterized protein BDZ99DRAFT_419483 [Mytilinidion resinicola]|uniref:Putative phospholipase n=1 Tax=Mytilinidion resinicola TaxID=574789 RepID=A0A6A6YKC1_9PEZI|nr:uncharacterized protein BDZ99DRAFT_419483 [Mytilinidion resinicola]KAF2808405.1 hypothetical protein BDZ99DRAFT_419483 [Mytilinidion resinicola]
MSFLSRFNPTPTFPSYTGPYKVGSVDVEIPATDLASPSPAPPSAPSTVAFRIFYPCEAGSNERPIRWIPNPQRGYVSAYARFLGANSALSHIFSVFPQLLYYVSLPVSRNARLLEPPTKTERWPVIIFSHGLGGSRNAYSHLVGSLASHGAVVIAPDHRDGSAPISYVRETENTPAATVDYRRIAHKPSPDVYEQRNEQLRIRLWEQGMVFDALLKIDEGKVVNNLDPNHSTKSRKRERFEVLSMFKNKLDVHRPGAITWAGHSFGATTTIQLVKSTFYHASADEKEGYVPLFTPSASSEIVKQITPASPVMLLDLWCLPLQGPSTSWLRDKPMPCYAPSGPGGTALLAIESEAFFKWQVHLEETKRVLSEFPGSNPPVHTKPGPRFFYPISSAHLSQSDFGILFSWVTTKVFGAKEPERVLRLNVRAMLQVMRDCGVEVADTSRVDMEETGEVAATGKAQDWKILEPKAGTIAGWIPLTTDLDSNVAKEKISEAPSDAVVEGEVMGEMTVENGKREAA